MNKFRDLTEAAASVYCSHVVARGPARLHELAHVVRASGGPIDLMDGSVESLEPLWVWWMDFARADFPGVEPNIASVLRALLSAEEIKDVQSASGPRSTEMLQHYVFEVVRAMRPSTKWDFPRRQAGSRSEDILVHTTGISVSPNVVMDIRNVIAQAVRPVRYGPDNKYQEKYCRPDFLTGLVAWFFPDGLPSTDHRGPRFELWRLLDTPTVIWDDPMKVTPLETAAAATTSPAPPEPTRAGEDTLFIARGADFDNLASAPPIDETAAARTLNDLGFRTLDGQPITLGMLQDGTQYFELPNQAASIDSEAQGGRLRSLILTPIFVYETEWAAMIAALTALGDEVGGELRGEGNF